MSYLVEFEGSHALRGEATLTSVVEWALRWRSLHHQHRRSKERRLLRWEAPMIETLKKSSKEIQWSSCGVSADTPLNELCGYMLCLINPNLKRSSSGALGSNLWMWCVLVKQEAAELSHLVAAGARATPPTPLTFQLFSSQSHCRATVPPIGSITATPAHPHAPCVQVATHHHTPWQFISSLAELRYDAPRQLKSVSDSGRHRHIRLCAAFKSLS